MLYEQVFAKVNGQLLAQNTECDIQWMSDITQIKTVVLGFAGISPGAAVCQVTFKGAVPITGLEYDFVRSFLLYEAVALRLELGSVGKRLTLPEAYIIGPVSLTSGIGKATEQDVVLVAKAAPLE